MAEKIRAALQAESAQTAAIEVRQGDMLVYSDGVVEVAAAERDGAMGSGRHRMVWWRSAPP